MTFWIVHFYFLRFRHTIRQFRHFVFRIGLYKTDRSAISLHVAAKTRTKPTDPPPTVERTNMTLTMASCRCNIFVISSRNKPLHCSHGRYAYRLIWCLSLRRSKQTLKLFRYQYRQPTHHLGGNRLKRNRRHATTFTRGLLCNQSFSNSRKIRRYIRETNHKTAIMDDIYINWFHGYYALNLVDNR